MISDSTEPIPTPPSSSLTDLSSSSVTLRNSPKPLRLIDTPLAQILQILIITDNLLERQAGLTKLDAYLSEERPSYKKLESEAITVINDQYNTLIRTGINTLKDFIQRFLDIYIQARQGNLHHHIPELFVKINHRVKKSFCENFTQEVKDLGSIYWTNIDGFNMDEYLATFSLRDLINSQDIVPKIQELVNKESRLIELAHYIMTLDLYKDFASHHFEILSKIIKDNQMTLLGFYIKGEIHLQRIAVNILAENRNISKAVDYIKTYDLDPQDFPKILHTLKQNALRYHQSHSNWMSIEERLSNSPNYLAFYVQDLWNSKHIDIALSIVKRYSLLEQEDLMKWGFQNEIFPYFYQGKEWNYQENMLFMVEGYTATEELLGEADKGKYWNLEEWGIDSEKDIIFIDDCETQRFEEAAKDLLGSKEVGLDSEFKFSLSKFDASDMALFQLATMKKIYLFDCPKLKGCPKYIDFIEKLMSNYRIAKVGHTLTMDLRKLEEGLGSDRELV